jgi:hypothetical protein
MSATISTPTTAARMIMMRDLLLLLLVRVADGFELGVLDDGPLEV